MTATEILSIAAVLLSPIIAIQVTRYLDSKKENRDRKMKIFSVLMGERGMHYWSDNFFSAINQIDVVFHNDESVRQAFLRFYDATHSGHPDNANKGKHLIVLLREMAKVLKLGNLPDLDIDKYYWTQQRVDDARISYEYYVEFLRVLSNSENFGTPRKDE